MRAVFLTGVVAVAILSLPACSPAPVRKEAATSANRGDVSGQRVEPAADQRYQQEPGVSYEQPAAFPDNPLPVYPPSLLPSALAPVAVTVTVIVNDEGRVSEVVPVAAEAGAPYALFFESVRAAVSQWKFFPLVRIVEGGEKTVLVTGDVSTTYGGQASRLPFSETYKFIFSQVSGVPSVDTTSAVVR